MNATYTMNAGYQVKAYARGNEYEAAVAKAKFVAMLVTAPPIGLVAVTLAPLAGLVALVWMAIKALPKRVKDIALFLAAPFIGLVYLVTFPLVGVGMLVYAGTRTAKGK